MRLAQVLFRRNRLPNGHIFRGKDRLVKKVEPVHVRRLKGDFELEEKNMYYLRHPYLTEEESHGHASALNRQQIRMEKLITDKRKIFRKDVTLFDRLLHLRVAESWDV